jgi:hypothetical protein
VSPIPTERIVYVQLLDEAVDVWRPVDATEEAGGAYRLPHTAPEGERWAFAPGTRVRCERRQLSDGNVLVAIQPA